MSREQSMEPQKSPGLDDAFAKPQLPIYNVRATNSRTDGPSSAVQSNAPTPASSSPLLNPKLAPSEEKPAVTSSVDFPGWGSSRRPPSPTKGLGGFVESAMMKRSDSVSKRWSVQAAPGLKRGDSVASSRGTLATGPALNTSGSPPRQTMPIRLVGSPSPAGSRPTSSHGLGKVLSRHSTPLEEHSADTTSDPATKELETVAKNEASHQVQGTGLETLGTSNEHVLDHALPASPTKTMDARRWSPTKSSWLESALARPESPKPSLSKPDEPAWKSSMHNAKGSIGSPPPANFEVNTTSLLRSPPMGGHSRPLSISGLPELFASGTVKKSPEKRRSPIIAEDPKSRAARSTTAAKAETADVAIDTLRPSVTDARPPREKSLTESDLFVSSTSSTTRLDPQPVKAKPATPPKTDFRSALRSRQIDSSEDSKAQPEFKAVFGKLKRAQTKNYVAPDELKDNIAKGKAALNLTGGPQKPKRVDEFKESILQKKEAMKEGAGLTAKPSFGGKPAPTVPEALAKKEAMKIGNGLAARLPTSEKPAPTVPEALAKRQLLGKPSGTGSEPRVVPAKPEAQPAKPVETMPWLAPVQKRLETTAKDEVKEVSLPRAEVVNAKPQPAAAPQKLELANSKLASRLNPALAGFLSRGASPKRSNNNSPAASTEDLSLMPHSLSRKATNEAAEVGGSALTHMTKARAKGPKRRAPKAEIETEMAIEKLAEEDLSKAAPGPGSPKVFRKEAASISRPLPKPANPEPATAEVSTPNPLAENTKQQKQPEQLLGAKEETIELKNTPREKPAVLAKSPELRKVSSTTLKPVVSDAPSSPIKDRMRAFNIAQDRAQSPANKVVSHTGSKSKPSAASVMASPLAPSTTRLNSPRSPSTSLDVQQKPPVMKSTKPVSGLGLDLAASSKKEVATPTSELTPPPEKRQTSYAKKSLPTDGAEEIESNMQGKLRGGSDTKSLFADFFDQPPKGRDKADFDTLAIMSANGTLNLKIKTMSMLIWEISGNGKKESMPAQQEHILFEDSMYLCVHTFQPENESKRNEAHLWVGDAVSEAAVEDAQLFCRKIAREHSVKLEVLKQGKETSNFFQALGGILITRRNKRSALYMLCGRRHLGHIAFDEVDFDPSSLCSGFPYIVSAKFGKLFLWKGRGSGADELGCARLIGMDLGLTGEIEEINEGEEPKSFWESFPPKTRSQSSDLWELKSTQDAYSCRLYRVEIDRPKSATGFWGRRGSSPPKSSNKALIEEISPFCQGDLNPHHIYLLDAYFDVYM